MLILIHQETISSFAYQAYISILLAEIHLFWISSKTGEEEDLTSEKEI